MLSLSAIGTPASGPGSRPTDNGVVDLGGAGAGFVGEHQVEGVDVALAFVDRSEVTFEDVGGAGDVVADVPGDVGGAGRDLPGWGSLTSVLQPDDRRHAEASVLGGGGRGEHLVAVEAVHLDVVAHHVGDRRGVRHRLDAVEVERVDVGEVVEHVAELVGRLVEFVVAQRQPSELGHLRHGLWGDAVGHDANATGPPTASRPKSATEISARS